MAAPPELDAGWKPGDSVSLQGPRVLVETALPEHMPLYARWSRDPSVSRFVWMPPGEPEEIWPKILASCDNQGRFLLSASHKRSGRLFGFFKLSCDFTSQIMIPTVAIGEKAYRGGKLSLEIAALVYEFAFRHLPIETIERRVYGDNLRVMRIAPDVPSREIRGAQGADNGREVHVFRTTRQEWGAVAPEILARLALLPDV